MSMKPVVINSSFTIENVGDIQEQMRAILARHSGEQKIDVDLSEVTEFDGAGMQLLLAFHQATQKMGMQIRLNNMPEVVSAALTRYNVISHFNAMEPL